MLILPNYLNQDKNGTYLAHISVIFYFIPKVPYLWRLYDIKIIKIEEIKNLTLGHLKVYLKNIGDCLGRQGLSIGTPLDPPLFTKYLKLHNV